MPLIVNLPGYEHLAIQLNEAGEIKSYDLCCSQSTIELFKNYIHLHGKKIVQWPISNFAGEVSSIKNINERRSHLLIQELILKARGEWRLPYAGELVCTCRGVSSEKINDAITAKARTLEEVSNWTTASTSCTTCKDKVEEIIKYRILTG